jgi:hypothetical protein
MALVGPGNIGRFTKNDVITFKFTMLVADVPTTLGGAPVIQRYEEGSTTESTGGITLTADYDSRTGLVNVVVDTSNAAYTAGKHYDLVITTGTTGAVNVAGTVVGHFALIPEPADMRMINGSQTDGNNATLSLKKLSIVNSSASQAVFIQGGPNFVGVEITSDPTGNSHGVSLEGSGTGSGLVIAGGDAFAENPGGPALLITGGSSQTGVAGHASGDGIQINGADATDTAVGSAAGAGIRITGGASAVTVNVAGAAFDVQPGANNGAGTGFNFDCSFAELAQGVPSATPSLDALLMLLYMALRNKLVVDSTGAVKEVYNNAGTRIAKKILADSGTAYSEAKMTTGA